MINYNQARRIAMKKLFYILLILALILKLIWILFSGTILWLIFYPSHKQSWLDFMWEFNLE